jgi:hypothetical protein
VELCIVRRVSAQRGGVPMTSPQLSGLPGWFALLALTLAGCTDQSPPLPRVHAEMPCRDEAVRLGPDGLYGWTCHKNATVELRGDIMACHCRKPDGGAK